VGIVRRAILTISICSHTIAVDRRKIPHGSNPSLLLLDALAFFGLAHVSLDELDIRFRKTLVRLIAFWLVSVGAKDEAALKALMPVKDMASEKDIVTALCSSKKPIDISVMIRFAWQYIMLPGCPPMEMTLDEFIASATTAYLIQLAKKPKAGAHVLSFDRQFVTALFCTFFLPNKCDALQSLLVFFPSAKAFLESMMVPSDKTHEQLASSFFMPTTVVDRVRALCSDIL
jgi:hypothetical protein